MLEENFCIEMEGPIQDIEHIGAVKAGIPNAASAKPSDRTPKCRSPIRRRQPLKQFEK